jgi:hypothetical protein
MDTVSGLFSSWLLSEHLLVDVLWGFLSLSLSLSLTLSNTEDSEDSSLK